MVGLVVEQHFLPFFPNCFDETSTQYNRWISEQALASGYKNGVFHEERIGHSRGGGIADFLKSGRPAPEDGTHSFSEIQDILSNSKPIRLKWNTDTIFTLTLLDGTFVHVTINNLFTGEYTYHVESLVHFGEPLSDAVYNDEQALFLTPDGRLVIARATILSSPDDEDEEERNISFESYPNFLPGLNSKRMERKLTIHGEDDLFIVWWATSKDDVFPWSPKPEQRANVLVYNFESEPELIFFTKAESDLLFVDFIPNSELLLTLEEAVDSLGKILVTETTFDLVAVTRIRETAIPMQGHLTCHGYDTERLKLALGASDSSIIVSFQAGKINRSNKTSFIPREVTWHPDSVLILIVGDRGQFQMFDIALVPMLLLCNSCISPSMTQQLEPAKPLTASCWSSTSGQILLRSDTGNLSILRIGIKQMTLLSLVKYYVGNDQMHEGINVLRSVEWNSQECLYALYHIFGCLIKRDYSDKTQYFLEHLLSSYFSPSITPNESVWESHGKSVKTVTRRYFIWLIEAERFEKALEIAISLDETVLFCKIKNMALLNGRLDIATEAMKHISLESSESEESDSASSSTHPTSCSTCTTSSEFSDNEELVVLHPPSSQSPETIPTGSLSGSAAEQASPAQDMEAGDAGTEISKKASAITVIQLGQV